MRKKTRVRLKVTPGPRPRHVTRNDARRVASSDAHFRRIVLIGASAGGIAATCALLRKLPPNFPFPILVVIHIGRWPSTLPTVLSRCGGPEATHPSDNESIRPGCVYVAPPNQHMLVQDGHIRLWHGPRENRARPAVDPLFRSAARSYRHAAIGIVLTGELDDGSAGMFSLKSRGGLAIVQNPTEAQSPSMPQRAMQSVEVDHCLTISEIAELLINLSQEEKSQPAARSRKSHKSSRKKAAAHEHEATEGTPVPLACPACSGPLFELRDGKLVHYQCIVGHSFSPLSLSAAHADALERAIWTALRILKERLTFQRSLAARHQRRLGEHVRSGITEDVAAIERDIALLEQVQNRL